jgi:hypothetical protein
MKQLAIIMVMLMYGFSSLGITVQLHYCCGKLKNTSLAAPSHKKCCETEEKDTKGCCETKNLENESDKAYELAQLAFSALQTSYVAPLVYSSAKVLEPQAISFFPVTSNAPPLAEEIFILNCVFRI